jgi:hypothetical protein
MIPRVIRELAEMRDAKSHDLAVAIVFAADSLAIASRAVVAGDLETARTVIGAVAAVGEACARPPSQEPTPAERCARALANFGPRPRF